MTKPILQHDPFYYGIVADAPYEEPSPMGRVEGCLTHAPSNLLSAFFQSLQGNAASYIQKRYPEAEVLKRGSVKTLEGNSCHYTIVRSNGEITVSFRGTGSWAEDGPSNVAHQFVEPTGLIEQVDRELLACEQEYGTITVLTGHSRGGFFATRVLKDRDIFRVVFNGHRPEPGEKNINLGTEGDFLTQLGLSDKTCVTLIGPGGHAMKQVLQNLQGKNWTDITAEGCGEQDEPCLQNITGRFGLEADELADALEQDKVHFNLHDRVDSCREAAQPIANEVSHLFTQFGSFFAHAIEEFSLGIYTWSRGTDGEKQRRIDAKRQREEYREFVDNLQSKERARQTERTLQELEFRFTNHCYPLQMQETVRETQAFSEEYKKNMDMLVASLQKNAALGQSIDEQLKNFDQLEAGVKKQYRAALASQKKLGKNLRKLGGLLRITGGVLRYIPGAGLASEAVRVAQGAQQVAGQALEKQRFKSDQWHRESMHKVMRIEEQCYSLVSQHHSTTDHLQRAQYECQLVLFQRGALDPQTRLNGLTQAADQQSQRVRELTAEEQKKIAESTALQAHLSGLHSRNQTLATEFNKIKRKKHKKKAQAGQRLQETRLDLAATNVKALTVEQEKLALQPLLEKNKQHLDATKKCLEEAAYVAPLEMQMWAVLVEEDRWSSDNEQCGQLQAVIQDNHASYGRVRQTEHRVVGDLMSAAQGFTTELERMTGHQKSGQVVSLASQLYQLHDLKKYWLDCALPQLNLLTTTYSDGNYLEAVKKLGAATFLLQYVAPAIHTLNVGLSCIRMGYELVRPPLPVRERLPEYMRDLVPPNLTQLSMEAELQLQALGLTLQTFNHKLDREMENLQNRIAQVDEKLSGELKEVRQVLNDLGDQILREIDVSRHQILQKLERTAYDQYVARIKGDIAQSSNQIAGLKIPLLDTSSKKLAFLHFVETIERGLENAFLDINNGINLGHGKAGLPNYAYEAVDLSLTYRNPTCFTGLLATKLGVDTPMPGWAVLEALIRSFIEVMRTVNENPEYQHIVSTDNTVQSRLTAVYTKIFEHQRQLYSIFEQLGPLVKSMVQGQRKLRAELLERAHYVRGRTSAYMKGVQQFGYDPQTNPHQIPDAHLVGTSKFFLFSEFRTNSFQPRVSSTLQTRFYDQSKVTSSLPEDASYFAQAQELTWKTGVFAGETLQTAVEWCNYYNLLSLTARCIEVTSKPAVIRASAGVMINFSVGQYLSDQRELSYANEQKIQTSLQKSVATICSAKPPESITPTTQEDFYLDQKTRQIVGCSKGPTTGFSPLFNLGVDVNKGALTIQFAANSVVQPAELEKIPSPNVDGEAYHRSLKNLVCNYSSFVHHMVLGGSKLVASNPFHGIKESCQIVSGIKQDMIPLAIPKELLQKLQSRIAMELHSLEGTGLGSLLPFYEVRKEEKGYRILIQYRFVPAINPHDHKHFCSFKIAEFDPITVRAFQKELFPFVDSECSPEFLIQACYGSFGANLGLPGQGTCYLNSGLIAPVEIPFIGLYRIWEAFPDAMISYNSYEYSQTTADDLCRRVAAEKASKNETDLTLPKKETPSSSVSMMRPLEPKKDTPPPSPSASMICPTSIRELGLDYLAIWRKLQGTKKNIQKTEMEREFSLLLSIVNLFASLDRSTLLHQMKLLHLRSPEELNALYDPCNIEYDAEVSEEAIGKFLNKCRGAPSQTLIQMQKDYNELSQLSKPLIPNPFSIGNQIEHPNQ